VLSNSSADKLVLKDVSRSPRRFASDQLIYEKDSPSNVDVENGTSRSPEVILKETSRSLRHPLCDSTNICYDNEPDMAGHCDQQPQPQSSQRRLLHPALARRRSSCVSSSTVCCHRQMNDSRLTFCPLSYFQHDLKCICFSDVSVFVNVASVAVNSP